MLSIFLVFGAIFLFCISGLQAYLFSPQSQTGQKITVVLMMLGAFAGISGVALVIASPDAVSMNIPWTLPWSRFSVKIDHLGCVFLLPVFIVPALGSIYAIGYWNQKLHPENGQRLGAFFGLLAGSMALLVIAHDSVLFMIAWEVMAISAFFAATVEDDSLQVRHAGLVYLIATHIGTMFLLAMFALWRYTTGSFELNPMQSDSSAVAGTLFILAVIGFGFKAGLMPLHVWLPGAHANAPSHVSAVMSAVMLKMGIYGIVRMTSLFPSVELWWGGMLVIIGAVTGIAGIAFAIGQQDIKRILAYSSIENIGIILLGLGCALVGKYYGSVSIMAIALGGTLLHVWNHSIFKSLLFMNAGAVIHAVHSRDIEMMGGLGKRMPLTMLLFVTGAVAICALPPLNGFISEWLIYIGFFQTLDVGNTRSFTAIPLGVVALAAIGPLAIACFVKMLGTVFLGNERSSGSGHAHDPSLSMLIPMSALVALCLFIGLFPIIPLNIIRNAVFVWIGQSALELPLSMTISLGWISWISAALLLSAAGLLLLFKNKLWRKTDKKIETWSCGYSAPTRKMQYSGSSFGDSIVKLLRFMLQPSDHEPKNSLYFPKKSSFKTGVPDTVLDKLVLPVFHLAGHYFPMVRVFQRGHIHMYVLYILIIVLVLFVLGR